MSKAMKPHTGHPLGERVSVDPVEETGPVVVDTFGGRVHVEWQPQAPVTVLGQLPFFIEYLRQGGLFDPWVADCPLHYDSPNQPKKRDVLGTLMLSVLSGHQRYAHITSLRCDGVNPELLGMSKVLSEDAVRRALGRIDESEGIAWLERHLAYCTDPLLSEPWILDVDTTVKPLYGRQEGAEVGYNPKKPGRPSHVYHTYFMAELRLALGVEVQSGKRHSSKHAAPGLWSLLDRLGKDRWPVLMRGDVDWGNEAQMSAAEAKGLPYLFRLRSTRNVRRLLEKAMGEPDWEEAGHGFQGKEGELQLNGWSRPRRVILLRRRVGDLVVADREDGQLRLSFPMIEVGPSGRTYEYGVLATTLDAEILTLAQLYRDRGDCENAFDELKNQWGWGGFTTRDMKRCQLIARTVALMYNWWSLFVRLADPDHRREAITSRPLLLHGVARQSRHAGQKRIVISSMHGNAEAAARALRKVSAFFSRLSQTAEQLTAVERWCLILSHALVKYLKGRILKPPGHYLPA